MSDKTITMPLEEYNELKARIEALETKGFYAKKIIRKMPVSFIPYWFPEVVYDVEFKEKHLCEIASDNDFLREANKSLSDSLEKIPSFIRKIFGS